WDHIGVKGLTFDVEEDAVINNATSGMGLYTISPQVVCGFNSTREEFPLMKTTPPFVKDSTIRLVVQIPLPYASSTITGETFPQPQPAQLH
ncbi:MAG: hypothetical protein ABI700_04435, partial [Chloroflexota bacterium]